MTSNRFSIITGEAVVSVGGQFVKRAAVNRRFRLLEFWIETGGVAAV